MSFYQETTNVEDSMAKPDVKLNIKIGKNTGGTITVPDSNHLWQRATSPDTGVPANSRDPSKWKTNSDYYYYYTGLNENSRPPPGNPAGQPNEGGNLKLPDGTDREFTVMGSGCVIDTVLCTEPGANTGSPYYAVSGPTGNKYTVTQSVHPKDEDHLYIFAKDNANSPVVLCDPMIRNED
jgi:hypothetical protein